MNMLLDYDTLIKRYNKVKWDTHHDDIKAFEVIMGAPVVDAVPAIRCKDCEHRPTRKYEDGREGFNLRFPDSMCPCQCDDPFYNWMPSDNWYCGYAKRKEE